MKGKAVFWGMCCLLTALLPLQATRVQRQTLTELRDMAQAVIVAKVLGSETRIGAEGKMVWTDYRLEVRETMRGAQRGPQMTVSFAGGRHGHLDVGIAGVPVLEAGRTYVLFLGEEGPFPTPTVGWGQGLFRVEDVSVAGTRNTVLISYDNDPLELTAAGQIRRGGKVEVRDGVLRALPEGRQLHPETPRQPDPVALNADGSAAAQTASRRAAGNPPVSERSFASLEDLRHFVNGQIQEIDRVKE